MYDLTCRRCIKTGTFYPSNREECACNQYRKNYLFIVGGILSILVAFSRLYLGQHFLSDVVFGLGFGYFVGYIWHEFCFINNNKEHIYALFVLPVLVGLMFVWGGELFSYGSTHTDIYFKCFEIILQT